MIRRPLILISALCLISISASVAASAGSLVGSWRGSGMVTSKAGLQERARCNVHITKDSDEEYSMRAYCATASGKVNQTATLKANGNNRFTGSFYNEEKDTRGTVKIRLSGNRYSLRMKSSKGKAHLAMRRR